MTDQMQQKPPRGSADADSAARGDAEEIARDAAGLIGDTLRARGTDFVSAVGEALRAGGDSLTRNEYRLAADCFDSAADRVESFWDELGQSAGQAAEAGSSRPLRRRIGENPALAYGAALAAGFLVGAFLRAGFDDPDEVP